MLLRINTVLLLITLVMFHGWSQRKQIPYLKGSSFKAHSVQGMVVDALTHQAIEGVNIQFGDTAAALTDKYGYFQISVSELGYTLSLDKQGYNHRDILLHGNAYDTILLWSEQLATNENTIALSWNKPKYARYYAGSQSTNQLKGASSVLNTSIDDYVHSRVAGLQSIRRSGTPGVGADLAIRGLASIYGSNAPLIVVDGVVYNSTDNSNQLINNFYNNALQDIDLKDIENVSVIKDALSTYGTKAAGGVIFIATRKAKQEQTSIDFQLSGNYNFSPKSLPTLNARDFRLYASDLLQSQGISNEALGTVSYLNDVDRNSSYYMYHNDEDWQNMLFNNSFGKNVYLNVSGGDNIAKYSLSLGYLGNDDIIKNAGLNRYQARFNTALSITSKLSATTNISFVYNDQKTFDGGTSLKTNPIFLSLLKSPLVSINERGEDGTVSPNLSAVDTFGIGNPLAILENGQAQSKNYRFLGNIGIVYAFSSYLKFNTQFGLTFDKVRENYFIPRQGSAPDTLDNVVVYSRLGNQVQRLNTFYNDSHFDFEINPNDNSQLFLAVGARFQAYKNDNKTIRSYNSSTDDLTSVGNGVNSLRVISGDVGKYKWLNNYIIANYSLLNKYILQGVVNVDGSSRFGSDVYNALRLGKNSYAVLPAFGAAWIVSSEKFFFGLKKIDLLKLHASIGLNGNDDIGNYSAKGYYTSQNLLGYQGLVKNNIGNPALQWESVRKLNVGLDLSAFEERLNLNVDLYQHRTDHLVFYNPVSASSGEDYVLTNGGALKNQGIDIAVSYRIIANQNVVWDAGITFSKNSNKTAKLPSGNIITDYADGQYLTQEGGVVNAFYGYVFEGVFATSQESTDANLSYYDTHGTAHSFAAGDAIFKDINGDGIIDENDRTTIGNPNPRFYGGVTQYFKYKNFSLNALFSFTVGNDIYNYVRRQLESGSTFGNQLQTINDRWRVEGQQTDIPKAVHGDPTGNSRFSTRWIEKGSYFKLRTLTLDYAFGNKIKAFRAFNVFVSGNNLFTISKYKGYDPEFNAVSSVFGRGTDVGLEPLYRTISLGVKLGL